MRTLTLPVIPRSGEADGGHAVAIVGYTSQGFIVQNSWGKSWGNDGFALLPYDDSMRHATDVWAAQLGVPVEINAWVEEKDRETSAGLQQGVRAVPLNEIRPYVIDVGNDGELSMAGEYWTTEADLRRLFTESIPDATRDWSKRRILLYLHGGLNDERTVARRGGGATAQLERVTVAWRTLEACSRRTPLDPPFVRGEEKPTQPAVSGPPLTKGGGTGGFFRKRFARAPRN